MNTRMRKMTTVSSGINLFIIMGCSTLLGIAVPGMVSEIESVTFTTIGVISTCAAVVSFLISFAAAKLIDSFTPRWAILIGSVLSAVHCLLFAYAQSPVMLYGGGILVGVALGLGAHAATAALINGWYDGARANTLVGIIVGVSTLGQAVYTFVGGQLAAIMGWRKMYILVFAFDLIVCVVLNLLFMRNAPKHDQVYEENAAVENGSDLVEEEGLLLKEAVKKPVFWFFAISMVAFAFITGISLFLNAYWQSGGIQAGTATSMYSLMGLIGAGLTAVSGTLVNKLGTRGLAIIVAIVYVIGAVCSVMWNGNGMLLPVLSLITLSAFYCVNSISSVSVRSLFGAKDYNAINAVGMAMFYLGSAAATTIVGAITDSAGYKAAFIALAVFAVVAALTMTLASATTPLRKK